MQTRPAAPMRGLDSTERGVIHNATAAGEFRTSHNPGGLEVLWDDELSTAPKRATEPSKLDATALRRLFLYDPATGIFTRRVQMARRTKAGEQVGANDGSGYLRVTVGYRSYRLHRLAWLYVHGEWPKGQIDHINGDRHDNRIANLRDATPALNSQNRTAVRNATGFLGVTKDKTVFVAKMMREGKRVTLGWFKTAEAAHAAYKEAKRKSGVYASENEQPNT